MCEFNWTSTIYGGHTAERRPLSRPEMRRLGIRKFKDLLRTVVGGGGTGRDDGLDRDDMTLTRFLNHVARTADQFETEHNAAFARMLDPEETAQPWEVLQPRMATGPEPKPPMKQPQEPKPQAWLRSTQHA